MVIHRSDPFGDPYAPTKLCGAGEVGVEGGWLGVHHWLRGVIDDATMNALFDQEAKLFPSGFNQSTIFFMISPENL